MQTSIFLARLLGPLLLLTGAGIVLNPKSFRTIAGEVVRSVTLAYLFGFMDLAAGLAIVLTHNVWVASWRVLIGLTGFWPGNNQPPGNIAPWRRPCRMIICQVRRGIWLRKPR